MPESTCLHIQDRESGPIRVVELPWISVRIGRAAYCEVRLPDADVGQEVCRLTRRGRTWSLIPSTGQGPILLEGRPLEGACPLPFDVPFRLGPYCLTLRRDVAAEPDWELYPASAPPEEGPSSGPAEPVPAAAVEAEPAVAGDTGTSSERVSGPTPRKNPDPDRWRARWKAAEAHLRSRAASLDAGGRRSPYSTQPDRARNTEPSPSVTPPMTPPTVGHAPRPSPAPSTPLIEPAWAAPRPDPSPSAPRVDLAAWPTSGLAAGAPQPNATRPLEPRLHSPAARLPHEHEAVLAESESPAPAVGDATTEALVATSTGAFVGRTGITDSGEDDASAPDWLRRDPPGQSGDEVEVPKKSTEAERSISVEATHPSGPASGLPAGISDQAIPSDGLGRAEDDPASDPTSSPGDLDDLGPFETASRSETPAGQPEHGHAASGPSAGRRPGDAIDEEESQYTLLASEATGGATRPADRGSRRRRPPRERMSGGRRIDSPRRSRREDEPERYSRDRDQESRTSAPEVELPSVRDILANHRKSPGPRPAVERPRKARQLVPTVPQEPGQWVLPGWIALPPVAACAMGTGLLACVLSWCWARDASSAAVVTQRLLAAEGSGRHRPLPDDLAPTGGRWIKTTAQHLAHWGIVRAAEAKDEPQSAEEAADLLSQALEVSPLNPTARLAMAQLQGPGRDGSGRIRGLGLSRDSVSLAWSARRLLDSGRKEAALRLYHRALAAAADGGLSRTAMPRFSDDRANQRYLLPAEDAIRDVVAELASREGLEFREWSRALPRTPVVLLATARLLREQGRPEAEGLLDELLETDAAPPAAGRADPRLLAVRAEALMLRSRWAEAAEQYRQAIEQVDHDLIRRSWWFNLADVAQRLEDEGQRQTAIRAALAAVSSDDITRRASLIQKAGDPKSRPRYSFGSARAN